MLAWFRRNPAVATIAIAAAPAVYFAGCLFGLFEAAPRWGFTVVVGALVGAIAARAVGIIRPPYSA